MRSDVTIECWSNEGAHRIRCCEATEDIVSCIAQHRCSSLSQRVLTSSHSLIPERLNPATLQSFASLLHFIMSDFTDLSLYDPMVFYKWDEDEGEQLDLIVSEGVIEEAQEWEDDGWPSEVVSFYDLVIASASFY